MSEVNKTKERLKVARCLPFGKNKDKTEMFAPEIIKIDLPAVSNKHSLMHLHKYTRSLAFALLHLISVAKLICIYFNLKLLRGA